MDPVVIAQLAKYFGVDTPSMEQSVREVIKPARPLPLLCVPHADAKRRYDKLTAAYELLVLRQRHGKTLRYCRGVDCGEGREGERDSKWAKREKTVGNDGSGRGWW